MSYFTLCMLSSMSFATSIAALDSMISTLELGLCVSASAFKLMSVTQSRQEKKPAKEKGQEEYDLSATTFLWDLPKGEATLVCRNCSCRRSFLPCQCASMQQGFPKEPRLDKIQADEQIPFVDMLVIVTAFVSIWST